MNALYWIFLITSTLETFCPNQAIIRQITRWFCNTCQLITLLFSLKGQARCYRKTASAKTAIAQAIPTDAEFNPPPKSGRRFRRKPEWVLQEVIYLLAMNPGTSLRFIESEFNRKYALTTNHTISHTYVGQVLQKYAYKIKILAKEKHNQRPRPVPRHLIWAADLTFLPDAEGNPQPILGVVEHASRACLYLKAICKHPTISGSLN